MSTPDMASALSARAQQPSVHLQPGSLGTSGIVDHLICHVPLGPPVCLCFSRSFPPQTSSLLT